MFISANVCIKAIEHMRFRDITSIYDGIRDNAFPLTFYGLII